MPANLENSAVATGLENPRTQKIANRELWVYKGWERRQEAGESKGKARAELRPARRQARLPHSRSLLYYSLYL